MVTFEIILEKKIVSGVNGREPISALYQADTSFPGRPGVATVLPLNYHWSTLLHMEVVRSVAPLLHFFMLKAVTLLC